VIKLPSKMKYITIHLLIIIVIPVLQERIHDGGFAETSIPEHCVEGLIGKP
jgi:hypothetical protein